jgi:small-conductance mechanosensitive channel
MSNRAARPPLIRTVSLRTAITIALLSAATLPLSARAQIVLPGAGAQTSAPGATPAPAASADAIRASLAAARKRLDSIEAAGDTPGDAPAGTPSAEIAGRLASARQLVSVYEQQLEGLDRLALLAEQRDRIRSDAQAWRGFDTPPPRSVLMVDALRDDLAAANEQLAQARERLALFQRVEEAFNARLKSSQAAARQATEAADRARGTPEQTRSEWQHSLATLNGSVSAASATLLQIARQLTQREVENAAAAAEFAQRKLDAAGTAFALPREALERVLAGIAERRRAVERDLARANAAAVAATEALTAARSALAPRREAEGAAALLAEVELEVAARQEALATATQRVRLLRELLLQLDGEKALWEARASALELTDPVRLRAARERLNESLARISATTQYLESLLATTAARLRDEEARHAGSASAAAGRLLEALRARAAELESARDESRRLERLLLRFRADFEERRSSTWGDRLRDRAAGAWLALRKAWNFELVAIDDSLTAEDGRKIAVSRSITVGKTFGAALIVLLGYGLASFFARRIERRLVRGGRVTEQSAALVRKWFLFVIGAMLLLVALLGASIPLTAFAFLGGALAIAAGFGLQNLLKNLVSGVMLLVERPLRLGDLIEVDGIRGRVTEIGIRASTIRSADGIESMIPNSRFVEGNLTNWTFSSDATRQTITIGVAYGSPLRTVTEILAEVLQRHGHVLKDPAPQVYADEFADSSINFSLTYWVEMTQRSDVRRVKSDLLLMIDRAFEDAGISIPFPQRDVRLTVQPPLAVQVAASPPPQPTA